MAPGEPSHFVHGTIEMLELSVKSWGGHGRVSFIFNFEHSNNSPTQWQKTRYSCHFHTNLKNRFNSRTIEQ